MGAGRLDQGAVVAQDQRDDGHPGSQPTGGDDTMGGRLAREPDLIRGGPQLGRMG